MCDEHTRHSMRWYIDMNRSTECDVKWSGHGNYAVIYELRSMISIYYVCVFCSVSSWLWPISKRLSSVPSKFGYFISVGLKKKKTLLKLHQTRNDELIVINNRINKYGTACSLCVLFPATRFFCFNALACVCLYAIGHAQNILMVTCFSRSKTIFFSFWLNCFLFSSFWLAKTQKYHLTNGVEPK